MTAPVRDVVTVRTGGQILGGWLDAEVTRSVESTPSTFAISLTERYPGAARRAIIEPGSTAEVYLGADKILTGYIDLYQPQVTAEAHTVVIAGRSKVEDLVDCSVDIDAIVAGEVATKTWEVLAATIGEAAKLIAKPYSIDVILPDDDPALVSNYPFTFSPGQTCFSLIEEMARTVQMLVWDDANGNLVISRVGSTRAANSLVEGQNLELEGARLSLDQRYSQISIVTQSAVTFGGIPHVGYLSTAVDKSVQRPRKLMIVMDLPGPDGRFAQQRADWEVARRYGRSRLATVTVTGWRDKAGKLWAPNTIVHLTAPALKLDDDLVIVSCTWRQGERGTTTALTLMPKGGLTPEPFPYVTPIPVTAPIPAAGSAAQVT